MMLDNMLGRLHVARGGERLRHMSRGRLWLSRGPDWSNMRGGRDHHAFLRRGRGSSPSPSPANLHYQTHLAGSHLTRVPLDLSLTVSN